MQFLCLQFCSCACFLFIAEAFLRVSDSALWCFLLRCFSHSSFFIFLKFLLSRFVEVFCASLCQHYCGFCLNTCASCFWFWHGRCNCFASCGVSAPGFLAVVSFLWKPFFFCTTSEVICILPRPRDSWCYFLCAISSTKSVHKIVYHELSKGNMWKSGL